MNTYLHTYSKQCSRRCEDLDYLLNVTNNAFEFHNRRRDHPVVVSQKLPPATGLTWEPTINYAMCLCFCLKETFVENGM
jgi:hypothetical protein